MTEEEKSFRLRYVGRRFDNVRLPVDVLSDLPAFRDLLAAFAKDEWLAVNAARQRVRRRVPKGFDKSIAFDLVAIEPGSAVPKLSWNRDLAQANLDGFMDELAGIVDGSFNRIASLIDDAANDIFPPSLSSDHVRALNRLGAGLREGERIELLHTEGRDGKVVYLDSVRRKQLITRVRETYQARFEGVGILQGAVTKSERDGYIVVLTAEHGNIEIRMDADRVRNEFDGNIGSDIQLELQLELDHVDKIRSVVEAHDVRLIDAELGAELVLCKERLSKLSDLPMGWNDGKSTRVSRAATASADRFLSKRPSFCGAYRIYPTDDGGILFEFVSNGWDFSVELGSSGSVEMFGIEIDGEKGEMEPVAFDEVGEEFLQEFDARVGR